MLLSFPYVQVWKQKDLRSCVRAFSRVTLQDIINYNEVEVL